LKVLRRSEKQAWCIVSSLRIEHDSSSNDFKAGSLVVVWRYPLRFHYEFECRFQSARLPMRLCGCEQSIDPSAWIDRQFGSSLKKGGRGDDTTACLRPVRGHL
jgi:hypothetical protein